MATAFDTLTGIPSQFTQGEVISWTDVFADYSASLYSLAYKFGGQTPLDGWQSFAIAATGSDTTYTSATPASVKPGNYSWEQQLTKTVGSIMRVMARGMITVLPNYATAQTTTPAAAMVTALQSALSAFAATSQQSVSFNGQSFSRANITDYQRQLVYFQAAVIKEQNLLRALGGDCAAQLNRIGVEFQPASDISPMAPWVSPFIR